MLSFNSLSEFAMDGWHNVKGLMLRRVTTMFSKTKPADLPLESGAVLSHHGDKLAVYKDSAGTVHTFSAVCTHMGCIVSWNQAEKRFDCPCHGSCFDATTGNVTNAPATAALARKQMDW